MSEWVLPGVLFLACIVVIVEGMSGRARQIAALVIAATAGSAATAAIAYRNSLHGQMQTLWFQILVYGLLTLAALRILDKLVRARRIVV